MTDRDNIGMMEKVAVAIFNSGFHPDDVLNVTAAKKWLEWDDEASRAVRQARAAMREMREPTEDMLRAKGTDVLGTDAVIDGYLDYWNAKGVWEAMIDAALSEGKTKT